MVRFIPAFILLGVFSSSALARFVCPGGRKDDTGKGMAAFRNVDVFYDIGDANGAYDVLEGYERMFDCTDECWHRGPSCAAIIYTGWDKRCKLIKSDHDLKLTSLRAYDNGNSIAVALKAEGTWEGGCDSAPAKAVPITGKLDYEGCCDLWY